VRAARGAYKRRDGLKKSAETGSRQVPRFGFFPGTPISRLAFCVTPFRRVDFTGEECALRGFSIVFAVVTIQDLFCPLGFVSFGFDLIFLIGS